MAIHHIRVDDENPDAEIFVKEENMGQSSVKIIKGGRKITKK